MNQNICGFDVVSIRKDFINAQCSRFAQNDSVAISHHLIYHFHGLPINQREKDENLPG